MFRTLVRHYFRMHGVDIISEADSCRFIFDTGQSFSANVSDPRLWRDMAIRGSLAFGEGFVDRKWDMDFDHLEPFLRLLGQHGLSRPLPHHTAIYRIKHSISTGARSATPRASHQNSSHHYDRGNELFATFLDEGMNYSCGFFDDQDSDLPAAQKRKIDTAIERLQLFEGANVLDIGCGWGSAAIEASRRGAHVTGINLAQEQIDLAQDRANEAKSEAVFKLADYREFARENPGAFDRILSIGMIEHVGRRKLKDFFDCIRRLLKPGGLAVVHCIVDWPYRVTDPWLEHYIFPGGWVPRTTEMVDLANAAGLRPIAGPYHHDGVNYATTLAHWRQRFLANYHVLDPEKYPERFRRLWVFYLAGCEAAFRALGLHNAQTVYQRPV